MGQRRKTYSAPRVVASRLGNVLTVLVAARAAEVVTRYVGTEVELDVGGRGVLEEREPLAVVLANTHVHRSPVTDRLAAVTPNASLLDGGTLGVNVVLGRGALARPLVVRRSVGAGQGLNGRVGKGQRNGFSFSTYLIIASELPSLQKFPSQTYQGSRYGRQQPAYRPCSERKHHQYPEYTVSWRARGC